MVLGLVLSVPAYMIVVKERILFGGTTMLLRQQLIEKSLRGRVVVQLDEHAVARFARIQDSSRPLEDSEHLLRFRKRGSMVRIATDAYFFQEGHADVYTSARYGELKVGSAGDAVLVGLRDEEFAEITPPVSN